MALALSVGDENCAHNCCASHPTSDDGSWVRGNRAAWASGPEKSRHLRQDEAAPSLGFDAMMASRFGLEASGIGGGALDAKEHSEVTAGGRVVGGDGGEGALVWTPMSNADGRGGGAIALFFPGVIALLIAGRLGREGLAGKSGVFS